MFFEYLFSSTYGILFTIALIFLAFGLIWAYIKYSGYDFVIQRKIEANRFKKYSEFEINTLRKKLNSLGIEVIETKKYILKKELQKT